MYVGLVPVSHGDADAVVAVVEKKGGAVKEGLITQVSNDADMITRRSIEAAFQLDGWNVKTQMKMKI